jgi:hypothetical protein
VVTFEEAVRKRPGMYFGAGRESIELPTCILQSVVDNALHGVPGDHGHGPVAVEVTADLRFTVADGQAADLDSRGERMPGYYGSVIGPRRWALAAAVAFSTRTLIEIRVGGRGRRRS